MNRILNESVSVKHLSWLLFLGAIVSSVIFSRHISVDQNARNQAQARETQMRQQDESQRLIESRDSDAIQGIQSALKSAGV